MSRADSIDTGLDTSVLRKPEEAIPVMARLDSLERDLEIALANIEKLTTALYGRGV